MATTLLLLGLALLVVASFWLALRLPLFHHSDELEHFDYALKLARHGQAAADAPLEADLLAFAESTQARALQFYLGQQPGPEQLESLRTLHSYEAYQPAAFYWLAAGVIRLTAVAGAGLHGQVLAVRAMNTLFVIAARVLVVWGLLRFGLPLALAALPWLALAVPVDLLRVSNDTPVYLLGAAALTLLARRSGLGLKSRHAALLGALVLAAVACKANAFLFLMPALMIALWFLRRELRLDAAAWGLALAPALLGFAVMLLLNLHATGTLTGATHLADAQFPQATGIDPYGLLPTIDKWVYWHMMFVTQETVLAGRRGADLWPHAYLVTLILLGQAATLASLGAGARERLAAAWLWSAEQLSAVRRWVGAGLLASFVVLAITTLLLMAVGQAFFWSSRLVMPLEFMVVLPAVAGWSALLAGPGRARRIARPALWLAAAALCAWSTLPYVMKTATMG